MSKSEMLFKKFLSKSYPGSLIIKVPDFKQINSSLMKGFPDFVVFWENKTIWYEVKLINSLRTLPLKAFTPAQMVFFKKMLLQGDVDVLIGLYNKEFELFILNFSDVLKAENSGSKSLNVDKYKYL